MNSAAVQKFTNWLMARPHWLLAGHLFILHMLAFGGWQVPALRLLLPVAVGLLLLWQPFVEGERQIGWRQAGVLLLVVLALAQWLNPWWMLVWSGTLAATIGGRVLWSGVRRERWGYLLVFGYLLALVILALVPAIAPGAVVLEPWPLKWVARVLWTPLLAFLLVMPARAIAKRSGDAFDFFYAVLVFLLLAAFVLGTLAFMLIARVSYLDAVVTTSLTLAGALFLLAWAWNPQAGFTGIGYSFSRYLLSIGMPLEHWLAVLNEESERYEDPDAFVQAALGRLLSRPWVIGAQWQSAGRSGASGRESMHRHVADYAGVHFELHFRHPPSPAMRWHFDWLLRLTAELYLIKQQARELQRIGYLQAIYETGARVTHDVKNLLQSLQTLCYASTQPGDPEAVTQLLGRQLPQIAERLKATLDKLQHPTEESLSIQSAAEWWQALRQRYAGEAIVWQGEVSAVASVPRELFDGVAENLLQNALFKRQKTGELAITVEFTEFERRFSLSVVDTGEPLLAELAERLFREPTPSAQGLGIGLYHAARLASTHGYHLELSENRQGCVRFCLSPQ